VYIEYVCVVFSQKSLAEVAIHECDVYIAYVCVVISEKSSAICFFFNSAEFATWEYDVYRVCW